MTDRMTRPRTGRCERFGSDCDPTSRSHLFHVPVREALLLPQVDEDYACHVPVEDAETFLALVAAAERLTRRPQVRAWAVTVFERCATNLFTDRADQADQADRLESAVRALTGLADLTVPELERVCAALPGVAGVHLPVLVSVVTAHPRFDARAGTALLSRLSVWAPNTLAPSSASALRGWATQSQQRRLVELVGEQVRLPIGRAWAISGPSGTRSAAACLEWLWQELETRPDADGLRLLALAESTAHALGHRAEVHLRAAVEALEPPPANPTFVSTCTAAPAV